MTMMNVRASVREYPDKDVPYATAIVRNHWNYSDRFVLDLGGVEYVFLAGDFIRAIEAVQKAHR